VDHGSDGTSGSRCGPRSQFRRLPGVRDQGSVITSEIVIIPYSCNSISVVSQHGKENLYRAALNSRVPMVKSVVIVSREHARKVKYRSLSPRLPVVLLLLRVSRQDMPRQSRLCISGRHERGSGTGPQLGPQGEGSGPYLLRRQYRQLPSCDAEQAETNTA